MASHVIEIARQEGAEFRPLRLALEDDGPIKMDAQDIGPNVTRISGSRTSVLQVWRSYGR